MQDLSFKSLIAPCDSETFFSDVWERRPFVIERHAPEYYRTLLTLSDVDRVLTTGNLKYPEIRLTKVDDPQDADKYTFPDGRIDPVAVCKLFSNGTTIILERMQLHIPTLENLCRHLSTELGIKFQTNLYLTPSNSGGFGAHYDTHDLFVLQVSGYKEWELFDAPIELPMPGQHHNISGTAPGAVSLSFALREGDILYIPRGLYHRARSGPEMSLHITLGAHTRSWCEFLMEALSELSLRDISFRRALPVGMEMGKFQASEAVDQFLILLRRFSEAADFEAVVMSFRDEFARTTNPCLVGQLLQSVHINNMNGNTCVSIEDGANYQITKTSEKIVLQYGNNVIEFPGSVERPLVDLLSSRSKKISDIDGELDINDKIEVVRLTTEIGLTRLSQR